MDQVSVECYCAFCRSHRIVYKRSRLSVVDVFWVGIVTFLLSLIIWQDLRPQALLFFPLGLLLAECFVMLRWRFSINCSQCGFDPILYKKNPEAAAKRVVQYMRNRREDPYTILSPPPKLPMIVKKRG